MTDEITREEAEADGREAYRAGHACDAPNYGRGDRRASWRVGWKKECAASGAIAPDRCPDCGRVGFDDCERPRCGWDQWDDGTRVTEKQRADGATFSDKINAYLAKQRP